MKLPHTRQTYGLISVPLLRGLRLQKPITFLDEIVKVRSYTDSTVTVAVLALGRNN